MRIDPDDFKVPQRSVSAANNMLASLKRGASKQEKEMLAAFTPSVVAKMVKEGVEGMPASERDVPEFLAMNVRKMVASIRKVIQWICIRCWRSRIRGNALEGQYWSQS